MPKNADIKEFRKARDWSQERLASELGVDQSTISRLESGADSPRPYIVRALERLSDLYPVEPSALPDFTSDTSAPEAA